MARREDETGAFTVSRGRLGRLVAVGGLVGSLLVGLAGGGAWAYFTSTHGSATGTGSVGTVTPVTVVAATGTPSSSLQPGSPADLTLTINNPNSFAVTLTGVSQSGGVTVVGGSGCTSDPSWPGTLGNSGVSVPTQTGFSVSISAGSGQVIHVASGASMSSSSNTGCQGATFQIPVTITVQK